MKTWAIAAAVAMLTAAAVTASDRTLEATVNVPVTVCTQSLPNDMVMFQAKGIAAKMFATANVTIVWQRWSHCPADGIRISMSEHTKPLDHPGAMAYALPYDGSRIVLFWDRIQAVGERALPYLLAHVLVHEVTHVLEGVDRHSDTGVLKAHYTPGDMAQMEVHPMPFAEEDVLLIHLGMQHRQAILMAGDLRAKVPPEVTADILAGNPAK